MTFQLPLKPGIVSTVKHRLADPSRVSRCQPWERLYFGLQGRVGRLHHRGVSGTGHVETGSLSAQTEVVTGRVGLGLIG